MSTMARSVGGRGASRAAASEKRKKQIVIGGAALLVVVLIFQFMRLSGGSSGAQPGTEAAPSGAATATPIAPGTATTAPTFATQPATRRILNRMPVKDPFVPLPGSSAAGADASAPAAEAAPAAKSGDDKPAPTPAAEESKPAADAAPADATPPPAKPALPPRPGAALLSINGSSRTVGRSKLFPEKDPAFRLVSVSPKAIKVGVAGGSFTRGRETITIRRGERVTLVNTATGESFVLRYVAPKTAAPEPATEPAAEKPATEEQPADEKAPPAPSADEGDE